MNLLLTGYECKPVKILLNSVFKFIQFCTFETPTFIDYYTNGGPNVHIKPHKALLFLIKNAQITGEHIAG